MAKVISSVNPFKFRKSDFLYDILLVQYIFASYIIFLISVFLHLQYLKIFESTDFESIKKIHKPKMAESIWYIKKLTFKF